ncbi:hypothetical protein [Octadecabacter sp. R77987]|uniref:hypothetical protein n=1 Tax=Octadecabacter sp. R77987 TaxID=3093874 RepID=UPI00366DAE37
MSAALLMMVATVLAGVIIVIIVPLLWARVGGIAGFAFGIIAIPAVWFGVLYLAITIAQPIWGDAADMKVLPDQSQLAASGVLGVFVMLAAIISAVMRRGGK